MMLRLFALALALRYPNDRQQQASSTAIINDISISMRVKPAVLEAGR